jgi:hypothetical protein
MCRTLFASPNVTLSRGTLYLTRDVAQAVAAGAPTGWREPAWNVEELLVDSAHLTNQKRVVIRVARV